jgi:hypothetical protein
VVAVAAAWQRRWQRSGSVGCAVAASAERRRQHGSGAATAGSVAMAGSAAAVESVQWQRWMQRWQLGGSGRRRQQSGGGGGRTAMEAEEQQRRWQHIGDGSSVRAVVAAHVGERTNGALKSALRTSTFKTSGKQVFVSNSSGKRIPVSSGKQVFVSNLSGKRIPFPVGNEFPFP